MSISRSTIPNTSGTWIPTVWPPGTFSKTVDVLVVIGSMFFQQAIYLPKSLVPPTTKVIQIDNNPWQIAKNHAIACGVEGDIKVALSDLTKALAEKLTSAGAFEPLRSG